MSDDANGADGAEGADTGSTSDGTDEAGAETEQVLPPVDEIDDPMAALEDRGDEIDLPVDEMLVQVAATRAWVAYRNEHPDKPGMGELGEGAMEASAAYGAVLYAAAGDPDDEEFAERARRADDLIESAKLEARKRALTGEDCITRGELREELPESEEYSAAETLLELGEAGLEERAAQFEAVVGAEGESETTERDGGRGGQSG